MTTQRRTNRALPLAALGLVAALAGGPADAQTASEARAWSDSREGLPRFEPRHAEHLWNRAGFGASSEEIAATVARGPIATVDELLGIDEWIEEPFYARKRADGDLGKYVRSLPEEEREKRMEELRKEDRAQVDDFLDWWVGRMLAGREPLRERMVLFWHGHFTSSMEAVNSSYEMIQQNQLFRRHALGSFRELLHAIPRDPAMLLYLDNASSRKKHPNENFARELLELYTLGPGHYTEEDVREVARAFTGWGQRGGRFHFDAGRHDKGTKRVLGVEGRLDGDDVIDILLAQEACATHLARELLVHFEGLEPSPRRLARYAELLRESDWRIDSFLRRLLLDPEFYGGDRIASRVASPLDYLVGCARRLGIQPDPRVLVNGSALLGQRLFYPPSVQGWEGGAAWATGASLLLRGELAGMLLGRVKGRDLVAARREAASGGDGAMRAQEDADARKVPAALRGLAKVDERPRLNLTQRMERAGARDDAELARALVDELLAVPCPSELAASVEERLVAARGELGLGDAPWSSRPDLAEPLLREIAHGVLALPEAQLD